MPQFTKVLIANRGEIAVRIIRACKDAGLGSVAVYADGDRSALHVTMADEAYSLNGETATETYLSFEKILGVAQQSGADAIHPGYGFLSENADFAKAVIEAGLVWIGPPPDAIRALGDKVSARHIAAKAGAPQVPGTADPVQTAAEVETFAREFGLPIAIKAAFGGGGRGLKVARSFEEIPELYESAVREATAAFGRGECFVERYLDKPRHVETQCLADSYGNVVVISTRDCSLQRRHQKLVEEAPAPYLTAEQTTQLYQASKAIMREAGYVGAGTCEFLIGLDGTISFLEVNTRLQVEHPVSEEVTGIDLVREMFRIAAGEALGYDDPEIRGHSIEFRINGEDPGRNFLPTPGTLETFVLPEGPGVRVDTGFRQGDVIGGNFDSLLAKLIVTGNTRKQALERARRALKEFEIRGIATVQPFHLKVVSDEAFVANHGDFQVHTRWIETEFENDIPAYDEISDVSNSDQRDTVVLEVNGKRIEVGIPANFGSATAVITRPSAPGPKRSAGKVAPASTGEDLTSPMQGTVIKIAVTENQHVEQGDLIVVVEAMKMEQPLIAHKSGVVKNLQIEVGQTVSSGALLCKIT
ncbi:MAG: Acetyl-/propionyl-coenzyme carboxylase alpha chain : Biotin carboxylase [Actinomycetota bacterium]